MKYKEKLRNVITMQILNINFLFIMKRDKGDEIMC